MEMWSRIEDLFKKLIVRLEFKVDTIQFTFCSFCILGAYDTFAKHFELMPKCRNVKMQQSGVDFFARCSNKAVAIPNMR